MMVCKITGPRRYSNDLHQGGLEVPCQYQFYSDNEERLIKVKGLIEKALYTTKAVIIDAIFRRWNLQSPPPVALDLLKTTMT